jgi:fluoroacetyl-CoA thioesterase
MSANEPLTAGMAVSAQQPVTPERTAGHIGSGSLAVYATPAMVAFIEETARKLCDEHLPPGQTTVGAEIHVRHLAPTPAGRQIFLDLEISAVEGRRVFFKARLRDEWEAVGEAEHTRVVIDIERFKDRLTNKGPANNL